MFVALALGASACGGGIRQAWSFTPVTSQGVSFSTAAVVVRQRSVQVRISVHNPTPHRVAINYTRAVLSLPDGSVVLPASSLAARIRVERSGGVGGLQYVPPGSGEFRIDFGESSVDYTTLPSMTLRFGAVLATNVTELRGREANVTVRAQNIDGIPLAIPPIVLIPPAGAARPTQVVNVSSGS